MGNFLNMGNGCTKRRLAGLNILHEAMVQVRLRKRKGNKSHSHGRKALTTSRSMSKELCLKAWRGCAIIRPLLLNKRIWFILYLFCYQGWLKPTRKDLPWKKTFSAFFFQDLFGAGPFCCTQFSPWMQAFLYRNIALPELPPFPQCSHNHILLCVFLNLSLGG